MHGASDTSPIYWYAPDDDWGWMCNLSLHGFSLNGTVWQTAEHYYQAHKFIATPDLFHEIRLCPDPFQAKAIARKNDSHRDPDWYASRKSYDIMKTAVRAKFNQNTEIARLLVSTYPRLIIERTDNDDRWGDGPNGTGQNWAGKILMEIRDELR